MARKSRKGTAYKISTLFLPSGFENGGLCPTVAGGQGMPHGKINEAIMSIPHNSEKQ